MMVDLKSVCREKWCSNKSGQSQLIGKMLRDTRFGLHETRNPQPATRSLKYETIYS